MTSITEIRDKADLIPDDELRQVCLKIIDEVANRYARKSQGFWTIEVFSRWVGRNPQDTALNMGVQLLASRRDAQLLEMHFIYFKDGDPDEAGEKIDDEEVAEALRTGYLIDPESGERVVHFEDKLVPYFLPASDLERA